MTSKEVPSDSEDRADILQFCGTNFDSASRTVFRGTEPLSPALRKALGITQAEATTDIDDNGSVFKGIEPPSPELLDALSDNKPEADLPGERKTSTGLILKIVRPADEV